MYDFFEVHGFMCCSYIMSRTNEDFDKKFFENIDEVNDYVKKNLLSNRAVSIVPGSFKRFEEIKDVCKK